MTKALLMGLVETLLQLLQAIRHWDIEAEGLATVTAIYRFADGYSRRNTFAFQSVASLTGQIINLPT